MFNRILQLSIFLLVLLGPSCLAYQHGYTWRKAVGRYHLVTGNKENFGDRRIVYNKAFHRHSALSVFLDCNCNNRGLPQFIYEYQTSRHCRGIRLYYMKLDSVFVFEEPAKGKLQSVLIAARPLAMEEKETYRQLLRVAN